MFWASHEGYWPLLAYYGIGLIKAHKSHRKINVQYDYVSKALSPDPLFRGSPEVVGFTISINVSLIWEKLQFIFNYILCALYSNLLKDPRSI